MHGQMCAYSLQVPKQCSAISTDSLFVLILSYYVVYWCKQHLVCKGKSAPSFVSIVCQLPDRMPVKLWVRPSVQHSPVCPQICFRSVHILNVCVVTENHCLSGFTFDNRATRPVQTQELLARLPNRTPKVQLRGWGNEDFHLPA